MAAEMFDLTGKVAIVTGATKGLGRSIAEGLAGAGASVVVSSRKQDLCDQAAAEIQESTGATVAAIACHVGEWDAIPAFIDAVVERFGTIDVLVNNAGISPASVTPEAMTLDLWRKVFSVNLEGPLRMSQLAAPVMRAAGGGSIVNVGSMAAYSGGTASSAYGASKAALLNLTKSMAAEWAEDRIRVNMVSPGPFLTTMTKAAGAQPEKSMELIADINWQRRIADPSEIVGPVLYLASDASSFVTGDDMSVSGGMLK